MQSAILYDPDLMIKRMFHLRRKKQLLEKQRHKACEISPKMAHGGGDQRMLPWNFITVGFQHITSSIVRPNVEAHNFLLKLALILMVQQSHFGGTPMEDPNLSLSAFLEVYDTLKLNDAIYLHLFSFSLMDKAWVLLHSLSLGSITKLDELTKTFLAKFF